MSISNKVKVTKTFLKFGARKMILAHKQLIKNDPAAFMAVMCQNFISTAAAIEGAKKLMGKENRFVTTAALTGLSLTLFDSELAKFIENIHRIGEYEEELVNDLNNIFNANVPAEKVLEKLRND